TETRLASSLPDYAQGSHGDLAEQDRSVGPTRGAKAKAGGQKVAAVAPAPAPAELARRNACMGCHALDKKLVGPARRDVAARYRGQADAEAKLVDKLRRGGSGTWGSVPMPANPGLAEADVQALVQWILGSAR